LRNYSVPSIQRVVGIALPAAVTADWPNENRHIFPGGLVQLDTRDRSRLVVDDRGSVNDRPRRWLDDVVRDDANLVDPVTRDDLVGPVRVRALSRGLVEWYAHWRSREAL